MAGLFDTFTIGKRGLSVNQSAINTTSHNIANANTEGYTRQRSVAETTRPFGGMSRFDSAGPGQVGTGAEITKIQRIRDHFIDYQVRNENGKLGNYDVASRFLSQIEDIFAEPSETGIQKLFGNFYASFQELAKTPEKPASRTVALQKTLALTDTLNHTYTQLEKSVSDAQGLLQNNVNDVNGYLDQINELNQQIAGISAVGQTPNDLMDRRDNLLDKVSKMFGITVERKDKEAIDLKADGFQATGNTIDNLVNSNPNSTYSRFSYIKEAKKGVNSDNSIANPLTIDATNDELKITLNGTSTTISLTQKTYDGTTGKKIEDLVSDINSQLTTKGMNEDIEAKILPNQSKIQFVAKTKKDFTITNGGADTTLSGLGFTDTSISDNQVMVEYYPLGDSKKTPKEIVVKGVTKPQELLESLNQNRILIADKDGNVSASDEATLKKAIFKIYEADNTLNSVDPKNIKGEIAGNQSVQDKIIGYMRDLNRIAASLAYSINAIVTGNTETGQPAPDGDSYEMLFVNSDKATATDDGITAKTITVNKKILDDISKLNCKSKKTDGERNGDRAQAIADLISTKINMSNIENENDPNAKSIANLTRKDFFDTTSSGFSGLKFLDSTKVKLEGNVDGKTVDAYYKDIISELGTKTQEANRIADNQREIILKNLENQRLSVSGVSLDEEMTNLIQFQHAYQANAKIISTIDELLDVVINGLKR